jgi:pimeloyl-ACP methyl ester carboxylesterase
MTYAARQQIISGMFVPKTPNALRTEVSRIMLATPEVTANYAGAAMFDSFGPSDGVITAPALTIYAGRPLFGQDYSTKETLPNWLMAQVPNTGHFLMMERPNEFNRVLADFLKDRAEY